MLISLVSGCIAWLSYEVGVVGSQITRDIIREYRCDLFLDKWDHPERPNQSDYPQYFKKIYIPPTIIFSSHRKEYINWVDWKGDRFA